MRVEAARLNARSGQLVRIACTSRKSTAVSVWGKTELGLFPFVPFIPQLSNGKPQFVSPLFRRFEGHHDFDLTVPESMTLLVMQEVDIAADANETGLTVRFTSNGRIATFALQIRRAIGDRFWALRRRYAGPQR